MAVQESGIIKMEDYSAPLGGKSYDSLHLASAFKDDSPHRFGVMVSKLFSASDKFTNKNITYLTYGSGNYMEIDHNIYRWTVYGDDKVSAYFTELLVDSSGKPGYGGAEFQIALDRPWFEEPDGLQLEDNRYPFLDIISGPQPNGVNSWIYTVKIQSSDPTAWIDPSQLDVGMTVCKATTSIADEMNDKRGTDHFGSGMDLESQIGMYGNEVTVTDKVIRRELQARNGGSKGVDSSKSLFTGYAFAVRKQLNGKEVTVPRGSFLTTAEAMILERTEMDREMAMIYGHAFIDTTSNGYLKRGGPGFRQLAKDGHELLHNGNLTAQTIEDYLHGIFLNRLNAADRDVVISTGEGGMRLFHQILQDEANSFLTVDNHFIQKASSNVVGARNPLSYGAQFVEFNAINGIRVRLMYDPMKDDPTYCKRKHPDNPRYTIDSFRMDIYDLGSPGSTEAGIPKSNMTMLKESYTDMYAFTSGVIDPMRGPITNGGKANNLKKDVTIARETSGSLCVWDTSRIGSIIYEPDFI
jgi:hypothetical protein